MASDNKGVRFDAHVDNTNEPPKTPSVLEIKRRRSAIERLATFRLSFGIPSVSSKNGTTVTPIGGTFLGVTAVDSEAHDASTIVQEVDTNRFQNMSLSWLGKNLQRETAQFRVQTEVRSGFSNSSFKNLPLKHRIVDVPPHDKRNSSEFHDMLGIALSFQPGRLTASGDILSVFAERGDRQLSFEQFLSREVHPPMFQLRYVGSQLHLVLFNWLPVRPVLMEPGQVVNGKSRDLRITLANYSPKQANQDHRIHLTIAPNRYLRVVLDDKVVTESKNTPAISYHSEGVEPVYGDSLEKVHAYRFVHADRKADETSSRSRVACWDILATMLLETETFFQNKCSTGSSMCLVEQVCLKANAKSPYSRSSDKTKQIAPVVDSASLKLVDQKNKASAVSRTLGFLRSKLPGAKPSKSGGVVVTSNGVDYEITKDLSGAGGLKVTAVSESGVGPSESQDREGLAKDNDDQEPPAYVRSRRSAVSGDPCRVQ